MCSKIANFSVRKKRHLPSFCVLIFLSNVALLYSQDTVYRQRQTNPNYEEGDWISHSVARFATSIAVGDQHVYFGTAMAGILRYDPFQRRWDFPFTTSNGLADNEIWTVAYDRDTGFIWCASATAVSYYQPTARRWSNIFKDEFGLPLADKIESIGIGRSRILFVSRGGRQFEANKYGGVILVAHNGADDFLANETYRWFGRRQGLPREFPPFFMSDGFMFDTRGFVEDPQFRESEVTAAVKDEWSNFWIATWGAGVARGDDRTLQLDVLKFGLATQTVNALAFHKDILWVGGLDDPQFSRGGLTSWDIDREYWEYFEQRDHSGLRSDEVFSITTDGDLVWFSTGQGLARFSIRERLWRTYDSFKGLGDNQVFDAAVDDSMIYAATANGISYLPKRFLAKKDSLRFKPLDAGNLTLVAVFDLEAVENLIWAGTNQGVYVYDEKKKTGGFMDEPMGPTALLINSISRYENEIWFGSSDGIDVYDTRKKAWRGLPEGRFFPNTPINRVLAAKDAVWAATDLGVHKYDRESKAWRTFTAEDGLLDNHVNAILLDGDYIWFGTASGITEFYWNNPRRID